MTVSNELIDQLLAGYKKPEDLIGENGLLKQLTKRLVERALEAEMTEHLGHAKNASVANTAGNARNGKSKKTLKGDFGELPIDIPRDRHASFEPQIVPKHQTRWTGFDDKILSLYARGMTVREIQGHLQEMYGTEVSPTLISSVTDAVMDEAKAWQARPLWTCPVITDTFGLLGLDPGCFRIFVDYYHCRVIHRACLWTRRRAPHWHMRRLVHRCEAPGG
jgi:putative transposase